MVHSRILRPVSGLEATFRQLSIQSAARRHLSTDTFAYRPPEGRLTRVFARREPPTTKPRRIKVPAPLPPIKSACAEPLKTFNSGEIRFLDPSGSRERFIARTNPDALKVGDVALVRFKSGDPFAGLVLNIRHRGQDSGILLRNEFTRVGTEMWVKLYSPNVSGFEIVQRSQKKMRRARAYYFRKPKHDRGSLANLVDNYIRETRRLGRSGQGKKDGRKGVGS